MNEPGLLFSCNPSILVSNISMPLCYISNTQYVQMQNACSYFVFIYSSNHPTRMDSCPSKLLYSPHSQNVTLYVDSGPRLYKWTYKCIPLTAKATYILKATTWQRNCSVTTSLFTTSTQSPTLLNTKPSIFPVASKEFYSPTSVPKVMQHTPHVMGM